MSFVLEMEKFAPAIRLIQQSCPLLVPLVEAGELGGAGVDQFIEKYWALTSKQSGQIDTLLLPARITRCCFPRIRAIVPREVRIVIQASIVAPSLADYLRSIRKSKAR